MARNSGVTSGFSLWFGVKPEVTPELRAMVEEDLRKPKPE